MASTVAKAHGLLPSRFELNWWLDRVHQTTAVLIQLALGGTCVFGFVCLYTEPSTFLGAMSTIMLSTVGLVDTADFLGLYQKRHVQVPDCSYPE